MSSCTLRKIGTKYSQVPLYRGLIYHYFTYDTTITVAESESDIKITAGTPYLALQGDLWGVYCEDLGENWPRYNRIALYVTNLGHPWYFNWHCITRLDRRIGGYGDRRIVVGWCIHALGLAYKKTDVQFWRSCHYVHIAKIMKLQLCGAFFGWDMLYVTFIFDIFNAKWLIVDICGICS